MWLSTSCLFLQMHQVLMPLTERKTARTPEMKVLRGTLQTRKGKERARVETKDPALLQEAFLELWAEIRVVAQSVSITICQVVIKHQQEELAKRGATFVSNPTVSKGINSVWHTRTKCPVQGTTDSKTL